MEFQHFGRTYLIRHRPIYIINKEFRWTPNVLVIEIQTDNPVMPIGGGFKELINSFSTGQLHIV